MRPIPAKLNLTETRVQLPPFELYRRLSAEFDCSFMLESAIGDQRTIAYSFLGFGPQQIISCHSGEVEGGEGLDELREVLMEFLKKLLRMHPENETRLPFVGLSGKRISIWAFL